MLRTVHGAASRSSRGRSSSSRPAKTAMGRARTPACSTSCRPKHRASWHGWPAGRSSTPAPGASTRSHPQWCSRRPRIAPKKTRCSSSSWSVSNLLTTTVSSPSRPCTRTTSRGPSGRLCPRSSGSTASASGACSSSGTPGLAGLSRPRSRVAARPIEDCASAPQIRPSGRLQGPTVVVTVGLVRPL